jgi:Cupin-like domain
MLGKFVSTAMWDSMLSTAQEPSNRWLDLDQVVMSNYNRLAFLLKHRLQEHSAFQLDSLFALCRRMPPSEVRHRFGVVPDDAHFDSSLANYRAGLTLDDAIEHLEERKAYIVIYNPETDAEYQPVIEGLLGEIGWATRSFEHCINWYSTYIFISSQHSVTPYHMDREMNFLLQIRGNKTARLWDPNDDAVMTCAERDHLFNSGNDARPTYRPELESRAAHFELAPGLGIHHPFIAPHLVHTGPELSISLAITFRTPRSDLWSDAHRFNERILRRFHLPAGRVGRSRLVDGLKAGAIRALRRIR